jgi:hypothetical protein
MVIVVVVVVITSIVVETINFKDNAKATSESTSTPRLFQPPAFLWDASMRCASKAVDRR